MGLAELRKDVAAKLDKWNSLANDTENLDREARDTAEIEYLAAKEALAAAEIQDKEDRDKIAAAQAEHEFMHKGTGRTTEPDNSQNMGRARHVKDNWEDDPAKGYASHREFLGDLRRSALERQPSDKIRFLSSFAAAGSDGHGTYSDSAGGVLMPEAFSATLKSGEGYEADPTAGRTTDIPMSVDKVKIPYRVDKTHTTSVSGGLQVYRRAESDTVPSSQVALGKMTLEADELAGVAYASNELLNGSMGAFEAILRQGMGHEFGSAIIDEKISGTGVGQYLGVLNSAATIEVAKEGSQAADTIVAANILNMRSRCWGYGNAIWLANHDTFSQIVGLAVALTNSDVPIFVPGNGTDVPDTLYGRPIIFTEHVPTLGDNGDIILADWREYYEGEYQPMQSASSIHVRFLEGEETFKFWVKNAGAPAWESKLTPKNSATTLSPFVTLAARA